jgi:hypothetical protein
MAERKDSPTMDLDLPTGRRTLLLGGTGVLAAAFLAACGDDSDSGDAAEAPTTTAPPAADPATDLNLSVTMASLEVLAVDTYQAVLDGGHVTNADSLEVATLFQQHHQQQLELVNGAVTGGGGEEITARNDAVYDELIAPKLAAAASEADVLALLSELEQALAQTYTWSCGTEGYTTPDLRRQASTIAGVDARHLAVLQIVGTGAEPASVFPASGFFDATNPLADIDGAMDEG